ncbi:MAG: hypothetical protein U1F46_10195 [Marinagarivorans sp.]
MTIKDIQGLIDKVLLIGITVLDQSSQPIAQIQVFGPIRRVDENGIVIERSGTQNEFVIPPDFENLSPAKPGEYRLRSTGDVVVNPDYLSSWTVHCSSQAELDQYLNSGFKGYERN